MSDAPNVADSFLGRVVRTIDVDANGHLAIVLDGDVDSQLRVWAPWRLTARALEASHWDAIEASQPVMASLTGRAVVAAEVDWPSQSLRLGFDDGRQLTAFATRREGAAWEWLSAAGGCVRAVPGQPLEVS